MAPISRLMFAAVAAFALAGCAPMNDTPPPAASTPEPTVPAKPPMPEDPTPEPKMTCDSSNTSWAMGQVADDALVQRIKAATGSKGVRVIKPGQAVTMDYREDRVNIDVDDKGRVTNVRCG